MKKNSSSGFQVHDISNKKFGMLYVTDRYERRRRPSTPAKRWNTSIYWLCRCDCGKEKFIISHQITSGRTKSCGCYIRRITRERSITHGCSVKGQMTVEYKRWASILTRCRNKNSPNYRNYGGRGIQVCKRWQGPRGFANFLADVGTTPNPKYHLDRINNNGNYEPGNCRWVTPAVNSRNRRDTVFVEHDGLRKTIPEWAEMTGLNPGTIRSRLKKGWPVAKALTESVV